MTPHYWEDAKLHLSKKDKTMAKIIASYHGEALRKVTDDIFHTLARAIVGQQISVKAADTIWGRFADLSKICPKRTLKLKDEDLRAVGFSAQKVNYIRSIAEFCLSHDGKWHDEDEQVIKELCKIKGVGRWTAEMFLIFYLQRPNVLPLADLGLLKAFEINYKKPRSDIEKYSKKWQPYASVATWYLWRSLDPVPVEY